MLLAFSKRKRCYYLPGGKLHPGESSREALARECAEELKLQILPEELEYHSHVRAPAFGEEPGMIMEQDCYLLPRSVAPVAAAEIGDLKYFTLEEYLAGPVQAPGAVMILQQLKNENRID